VVVCRHHLLPSHLLSDQRDLLALDQFAAAKDDEEVLGFQSAECGGEADGDQ